MNNTLFLNIGAEPNSDLVKVSPENSAVPDGRSVKNVDLASQYNVGSNISVYSDLREPLT